MKEAKGIEVLMLNSEASPNIRFLSFIRLYQHYKEYDEL